MKTVLWQRHLLDQFDPSCFDSSYSSPCCLLVFFDNALQHEVEFEELVPWPCLKADWMILQAIDGRQSHDLGRTKKGDWASKVALVTGSV